MVEGTSTMRTTVASRSTAVAMPETDDLHEHLVAEDERAEDGHHDGRGRRDHPAGAGHALGHRFALSPVRSYSSRMRESRKTS